MELKEKAMNTLPAGTVFFEEGADVTQIAVVLKGKVEGFGKGMRVTLGSGSFLGVTDVVQGGYQSSWQTVEESSLFVFPVSGQEDLAKILQANKDYPGLLLCSMSRQLSLLWDSHQAFMTEIESLHAVLQQKYQSAVKIGAQIGHEIAVGSLVEGKKGPTQSLKLDKMILQGYMEIAQIAPNVQKAYYGLCPSMAYRQIVDISLLYYKIHKDNEQMTAYITELLQELAGGKNNLLTELNRIQEVNRQAGGNNADLQKIYQEIEKLVLHLISFIESKTGIKTGLTADVLVHLRQQTGENGVERVSGEKGSAVKGVEEILDELSNSLEKLMEYGKLPEDRCNVFRESLRLFIGLKDKFATEDAVRRLRKGLSDVFYELYEAVFLRDLSENTGSRLIELFLNYGYISEKLLDKNQLIQLYHRAGMQEAVEESGIRVYTMKEWLRAIYSKEKDPSKNEFDMDFYEDLRDKKKSVSMSEAEEKAYLADSGQRLSFEIHNMFRINSRMVCGQLSSFVPFLFQEKLSGDLSRCLVTKEMVRAAMLELQEVDYSVFYREMMLVDEEHGIKKEFIQKKVCPDVVLLSVAGSRGSMWQDISGRRRDSAGRFLLPILLDSDIKDNLIPMFGRFRWELCRTIQGASWNDIKVKSLTSEYSDYIQFYRKNKDLSEERREKVKAQIQKARNNTREVFVSDYETWMKFESQGSMRLNKVVREMLAMYCPFKKEIRDTLAKQGPFEEAMSRFNREQQRKQKEFELRMHHLEKENGTIVQELKDTMSFYQDM